MTPPDYYWERYQAGWGAGFNNPPAADPEPDPEFELSYNVNTHVLTITSSEPVFTDVGSLVVTLKRIQDLPGETVSFTVDPEDFTVDSATVITMGSVGSLYGESPQALVSLEILDSLDVSIALIVKADVPSGFPDSTGGAPVVTSVTSPASGTFRIEGTNLNKAALVGFLNDGELFALGTDQWDSTGFYTDNDGVSNGDLSNVVEWTNTAIEVEDDGYGLGGFTMSAIILTSRDGLLYYGYNVNPDVVIQA